MKVQATKFVKNDGTYPHRDIGDILVRKGDVGYVRDIGTFLQRFYVYAVEFVDRGVVSRSCADAGSSSQPTVRKLRVAHDLDRSVQEAAA